MNKSVLKTFATSARKELLKKVEAKAMKIGITEETIKKTDIESSDAIFIDGKKLSKEEKAQRAKLIARINQIGFKQVIEEVAYTWFNRFSALRFMEVNDYLPTGVRVLSSSNPNSAEPDMLNEALELDLEIDKEYVYELKLNNKTEELFKYLIIKHCNNLNKYLPFMFKTIDDYTEVLFPEGLLTKESFVRQMTDTDFIPEDNWQKVEIVGWLYQYYIAEEKDRVIKAKKKYKTEEISFATQLFTPDWIVRYMVQNSLGRYWVESHPEHRDLLGNWEFYLENPNPEPDFAEKLAPYINKELKVEEIKCFDPAMGSGHILVYMFDVLYEIYGKCGYMEREIPRLIIENNLYGVDIDDRAYQLACFSVVMKAMAYNGRFFRSIEREGLILNLASIQETNALNEEHIVYIAGKENGIVFEQTKRFIENFTNAKTYGSLIKIAEYDREFLAERLEYFQQNPAENLFTEELRKSVVDILPNLLKQAAIMDKTYDVLVTNPPYMGSRYMNSLLSDFIKKEYPGTKSDVFSVFLSYCLKKVSKTGHLGFLTPVVWMFISAYEELRKEIVSTKNISSLIQLEYNSFPEATVHVGAFTLRNYLVDLSGEFINLENFTGSEIQPIKTLEAIQNPFVEYRYTSKSTNYDRIPGNNIGYWISQDLLNAFEKGISVDELSDFTGSQNITANNNKYLRKWWEISKGNLGKGNRWVFYAKGGSFRKHYGNLDIVIDWGESARSYYKNNPTSNLLDEKFWYKEGITYTDISSTRGPTFRYLPPNCVFDKAGPALNNVKYSHYILAFFNSKVAQMYLDLLNPTMHIQVRDVKNLPIILEEDVLEKISEIQLNNVKIAKEDWDSFETSFDYQKHPFMNFNQGSIKETYELWNKHTHEKFNFMKANEEKLNEYFIRIYGLKEVLPNVDDRDITARKGDLERDIKSYISYAIGCILGRYSIEEDGLIFTGGEFNPEKYQSFQFDRDNILPILPGAYFEDDIVSKFIEFVRVTFAEEKLAENLEFIADTLGKKKGETAKETIRRYFLNDFFKDHVQTYKKRPIYWLFTSGKQKAFNCLIYMHRYDKTTLSRIRTDYLHEYQIRLDAEKKDLLGIIEGDYTTKEISNAKKGLKALDKKIEELKEYDELLHHMADMQMEIDLDDGVVVNYEKFKGLVAKI